MARQINNIKAKIVAGQINNIKAKIRTPQHCSYWGGVTLQLTNNTKSEKHKKNTKE